MFGFVKLNFFLVSFKEDFEKTLIQTTGSRVVENNNKNNNHQNIDSNNHQLDNNFMVGYMLHEKIIEIYLERKLGEGNELQTNNNRKEIQKKIIYWIEGLNGLIYAV